jgi:hypothetical protein
MDTAKKVYDGHKFDDMTVRRNLMAAKALKTLMQHEAQRMRQRQQLARDHMGGAHTHMDGGSTVLYNGVTISRRRTRSIRDIITKNQRI